MLTITSIRLDHGFWGDEPRLQITDSSTPIFDWSAASNNRNDFQSAYRAVVKQNNRILWDSDWVESNEQTCIYDGKPLTVDVPLDFSLQIRNHAGEYSEIYTKVFYYVNCNFAHNWIVDPAITEETNPAPVSCFIKDLTISKPINQAVLYDCGIGYQQVKINGFTVDNALLDPATSDYTKRCYVAVHPNVTNLLKQGKNRLIISVAGGWRRPEDGRFFTCYSKEYKCFGHFFGLAYLMAVLHIIYTDGEEEWIRTDNTWDCVDHPCTRAQLYGGETYDSRVKGNDLRKAKIIPAPCKELSIMTIPPIKVHESYRPISISPLSENTYVVDFGQNIAGVCRLKLPSNLINGQKIIITHSEEIEANGDISFSTMRNAANKDEYIAVGDGTDLCEWQPSFTYHGFRYVRIEGLEYVGKEDIIAYCLRTAIPKTGDFRSGSAILNAVHQAVIHTEQDNIMSILTDCPQRDERAGWMNDATVRFEETPYNFDTGRIFKKVLNDIKDAQSLMDGSIADTAPCLYGSRPADPVCSSYLILGEKNYLFSGDKELLKYAFEGFSKWQDCLTNHSEGHIINYSYYGDWASPQYACVGGDKDVAGPVSSCTPGIFVSTCYYYYNACLLAKFAKWLGYNESYERYMKLAEDIKRAILNKWWDADSAIICTGSQGCQSIALWMDIIPQNYSQAAADRIHEDLVEKNYKITTGNLCTTYLMDVLSRFGYEDDAYKLLTREEYPSIGFMLQHEATTVWERFELKTDPSMNSHNHPMYGAVDKWMYSYAAGIQPIDIAFKRVRINPVYPTNLQSVNATIHTVKGDLTVRWIKRFNKTELRVIVPFGVTADITVGDRVETVGSGFWTYTF